MISFKTLLNKLVISFFSALLFFGCGEKQPEDKYAAKIGSTVLTEDEVDKALSSRRFSHNFRNEFIRNWIETELLYREAEKSGILEKDEYLEILAGNSKQLAAALMLADIYSENIIEIETGELEKFYEEFRPDFSLIDDASVVNLIRIKDYEKSIYFRNKLINSDWTSASNLMYGDSSVVVSEINLFSYDRNFSPPELMRIIKGLMPGETSIIFEEEPGCFLIVQLVQKFQKGEIPAFEIMRNLAEEKFLLMKRKTMFKNLIKDLYSKYDVEITTESK